MESPGFVLGLAVLFLALMIALSVWAERQLPDGPVPTHFDIRGKADAFGSRWITLGILPITYVLVLALTLGIRLNTSPVTMSELLVVQLLVGLPLLAAHGFIMFLLLRWARNA